MRDNGKSFNPKDYDNSAQYLSNLSGKKTQYQMTNIMRDFEFKKENLIEILEKKKKLSNKEYKVNTQGKFAESVAQDPGENFKRDI